MSGTDQNGKAIFLGKLQCGFYTKIFNYVVYLKPCFFLKGNHSDLISLLCLHCCCVLYSVK